MTIESRLKDPGWKLQTDPLKDTVPIPQAGGLEYAPSEALGYVWAVAIASGQEASKNCSNTPLSGTDTSSIEIKPLGRYWHSDPAKCQTKPVPEQNVSEVRMTAGAAGQTSFGGFLSLSGQADTAVEMIISHPTHVAWADAQACRPVKEIAARPFQRIDRICKLYWVNNVKQTKIYYREYTNIKVAGEGGFSLIKLGADAYSNSSSMQSATILSGNYEDITAFVARDETTGYVFKSTNPTPVSPPSVPPTEDMINLFEAVSLPNSGTSRVRSVSDTPDRLRGLTSEDAAPR